MVLEMVLPKLFKKSNVSILNTWKEEIVSIAVKIPNDSKGKKTYLKRFLHCLKIWLHLAMS